MKQIALWSVLTLVLVVGAGCTRNAANSNVAVTAPPYEAPDTKAAMQPTATDVPLSKDDDPDSLQKDLNNTNLNAASDDVNQFNSELK